MKVAAYVRVSTAGQADDGISLAMQRERVTAFAVAHGFELVEIFEDAGASAKSLDRAGLRAALVALEGRAVEGLIVYKLDRLTRSVRDLGALLEGPFARARLLSVSESLDTGTPIGRLVINIMGSVAQWEREEAASRTSAALGAKSARGGYVGGAPPFGWRVDAEGALEADPVEQQIVEAAREIREGGASLRATAAELTRRGWRSRTGRPFAATQVRRMLGEASRAFDAGAAGRVA